MPHVCLRSDVYIIHCQLRHRPAANRRRIGKSLARESALVRDSVFREAVSVPFYFFCSVITYCADVIVLLHNLAQPQSTAEGDRLRLLQYWPHIVMQVVSCVRLQQENVLLLDWPQHTTCGQHYIIVPFVRPIISYCLFACHLMDDYNITIYITAALWCVRKAYCKFFFKR